MARSRSTPGAQINAEGAGPSTATREAATRRTRSQTRSVSVDPKSLRHPRATRQTSMEGSGRGQGQQTRNIRGNDGRTLPLEPVPEDVEAKLLNDNVEDEIDTVVEDNAPESMALVRHTTIYSVSPSPSQMTNYTAFSQYELRTLDADLIMDNLEQLGKEALRLLRLLVPEDATEEDLRNNIDQLYEPNSRLGKRLTGASKNLASLQDEYFGHERYIRSDHILRALFAADHVDMIPEGPWRPDAIIHEGNLANLVTQLSQIDPNSQEILDVLGMLDNNFPMPFMSSFPDQGEPQTTGSSQLFGETYYLALDLRTQLAIMNIIKEEPTTRQEVTDNICRIFMRSDVSEQQVDVLGVELYPRLWDGLPVLEDSINSSINQRVEDLRMPFDAVDQEAKSAETARREIQRAFPWIDFQAQVLKWAQLRLTEIEAELDRSGGRAAIVSALERKIAQWKSDPDTPHEMRGDEGKHLQLTAAQEHQHGSNFNAHTTAGLQARIDAEAEAEAAPASTVNGESPAPGSTSRLGRKTWSKGGMSFLKKHKASTSRTGASTAPSESLASEPVQLPATSKYASAHLPEDDYQNIDDVIPDGQEDAELEASVSNKHGVDSPPRSPLKQTIARLFAKSGNKENRAQPQQKKSLLDPQENGERVRWEDDIPSQHQSVRPMFRKPEHMLRNDEPVISPQKRGHQDLEVDDPSEDEGFEHDPRQPTTTRRRFEDGAQSRPRPQDGPIESSGPLRQSGEPSVHLAEQYHAMPPPKLAKHPRLSAATSSRKNPGQLIEPLIATAPTEDDEQPTRSLAETHRLNADLAKMRTRTVHIKEPRARTPWSSEETETLIDLIGEHGCSWTLLKSMDAADRNVLEGREQGDLKDKARNMKVDYLMGTGTLPKNFDMVMLAKKEREKLEKYGIPYEQSRIRNS